MAFGAQRFTDFQDLFGLDSGISLGLGPAHAIRGVTLGAAALFGAVATWIAFLDSPRSGIEVLGLVAVAWVLLAAWVRVALGAALELSALLERSTEIAEQLAVIALNTGQGEPHRALPDAGRHSKSSEEHSPPEARFGSPHVNPCTETNPTSTGGLS